jgi:uncharacterized membrane protein (DUF106 family)
MAKRQQSSFLFFFLLMIAFLIIFDPVIRDAIAIAVNYILYPIIGFNGNYPLLTVFVAGSLVIIISAVVRHLTTDWIEMAKMQEKVSEFQKKYREALKSQNKYMIKKLQSMQQEIMLEQSNITSKQFKIMPLTIILFIPIFTWIWEFLYSINHYYFDTPWQIHASLFKSSFIFPNWILLYMLFSVPFTQFVQYLLRLKWLKEA